MLSSVYVTGPFESIRLTCCYFYLLVLISCSSQFISNLPSSAFKYSVLVQCNNEFLLLVLGYILGYCSSIRFYLTLNPIEYVSWKEGSEVCATLHFNDHTLVSILVFSYGVNIGVFVWCQYWCFLMLSILVFSYMMKRVSWCLHDAYMMLTYDAYMMLTWCLHHRAYTYIIVVPSSLS